MISTHCPTCNTSNVNRTPFCSRCGTALKIRTVITGRKYKPLQVVALINSICNMGGVLLVLTPSYLAFSYQIIPVIGLLVTVNCLAHLGFAIAMFAFRKKQKYCIRKVARIVIVLNFWLLMTSIANFILVFFSNVPVLFIISSVCFMISYTLPLVIFILSLLPSKDIELKELSNVF